MRTNFSLQEADIIHLTHTGHLAGVMWCVGDWDNARASTIIDAMGKGLERRRVAFAHLGSWVDNRELANKLCPHCHRRLFGGGTETATEKQMEF